nr:efflux RND transporter periplasmic adaptor subunit [Pseudopedobacter sp.]
MERMWRNRVESLALSVQSEKLRVKSLKKTTFLLIACCFILSTLLLGCQSNTDKKTGKTKQKGVVKYTCSMHPQVIKDGPGTCPICWMDLVRLNHQDVHLAVDADLKDLIKPTNESIVSNIKTIHPQELSLSDTILLNGKVSYDTRQIKTITARFGGRIERMFVKYNFQKVVKGQKIMEVYSPDLAAAQQELLYLKAQDDPSLLTRAKEKIRLLGIDNQQINQIIKSGKVNYHLPIYSNYSGYVVDPVMDKRLNEKTDNTFNDAQNAIAFLQGQYIKTGDMLFKVFNQQQVWGIFYVDAHQQQHLKSNQSIGIIYKRDTLQTKISLVQPYYDGGQPYTLVRVTLNNDQEQFHIGEFLKAQYISPAIQGLWVPTNSVYKLGNRSIIFIKEQNILTAKVVQTGATVGKQIQIINGLQKGDEIAESAAYLIDTESFIQIN